MAPNDIPVFGAATRKRRLVERLSNDSRATRRRSPTLRKDSALSKNRDPVLAPSCGEDHRVLRSAQSAAFLLVRVASCNRGKVSLSYAKKYILGSKKKMYV